MASSWPVLDIWNARHSSIKELHIDLVKRPQQVLICRPSGGWDVRCEELSSQEYHILDQLRQGAALGIVIEELVLSGQEDNLNF